jgi:hypothetical protein
MGNRQKADDWWKPHAPGMTEAMNTAQGSPETQRTIREAFDRPKRKAGMREHGRPGMSQPANKAVMKDIK